MSMPKFDTVAKMGYRERVLKWLREELVGCWDENGALLVDYCELAGPSGDLTVELFESRKVFGPCSVHIGVDQNAAYVEEHKRKYPHHRWYVGMFHTIFNAPEFDRVGIWNADGTDEVGGKRLRETLPFLADRVCRSLDSHDEVAVLLNCCLDSVVAYGRGRPSEVLQSHARTIATTLTKSLRHHGFQRRHIEAELLLPEHDVLEQLDDFQFESHDFGAFDIHRTEKLRMANFRMVLI